MQMKLMFEQDSFSKHPQNTSTFQISAYAFIRQELAAGDSSYIAHCIIP